MHDWDSDMLIVDDLGDALIQDLSLSWPKWNWSGSEKFIALLLNLILSDLVSWEGLHKMLLNWRLGSSWRLFRDRVSLYWFVVDILLSLSLLRKLLVVILVNSNLHVSLNLFNSWLDLVILGSFKFEFFTVSSMLIIEEFLIVYFHFFKFLIVDSVSLDEFMHFFFVLFLFPVNFFVDLWDLSMNMISFLNNAIGMISGIINLLDPSLFFFVKFILILSFDLLDSVSLRLNMVSSSLDFLIILLLLDLQIISLLIIIVFSDN